MFYLSDCRRRNVKIQYAYIVCGLINSNSTAYSTWKVVRSLPCVPIRHWIQKKRS